MGMKKKNGVKKNHGCQNTRKFPVFFSPSKSVKNQGNSFYFFFAKYTRFVRNFLKKLFLVFFSKFFTSDTLKTLLGGPKVISVIY